jgi:acyl carrier protein
MSNATLERISELMRDLFDDYLGPITRDTTARDVPQWDSLAHVQLLVMIEQAFGVRFASNEIHGLKCLGDLIDAIDRKRATT